MVDTRSDDDARPWGINQVGREVRPELDSESCGISELEFWCG